MKKQADGPQIIVRNAKPAAVILEIDQCQDLLERAKDTEDLERLRAMRKKPLRFKTLDDVLTERRKHVRRPVGK